MADGNGPEGLRDRLARQGEDALGKLAQDLLENPLVNSAISRAFEARERATQAQEVALAALNIPTAADIERLTRRLRSVSQRLEGIEDGVDRLDQRLAALGGAGANPLAGVDDRLAAIEAQLSKLATDVSFVSGGLDASPAPVPREQERLEVDAPPPPPKPSKRAAGGSKGKSTAKRASSKSTAKSPRTRKGGRSGSS
jgi:hypothetical protein